MLTVAKSPNTSTPKTPLEDLVDTVRTVSDLNGWLKRGLSEPFALVVDLTPELARALLERNASNRPFVKKNYDALLHAVKSGEFRLNGETIVVSKDGFLNDGQHRCEVVADTGITIRTFIAFGVERDTRSTVDRGSRRTMGHVFTMNGLCMANTNACAAIARWVLNAQADSLPTLLEFSEAEYLRFAEEHEERLVAAYGLARQLSRIYCLTPAPIGMAIYLCSERRDDVTAEMLRRLISGTDIQSDTPLALLHRRYRNHALDNKLSPAEQAALFIVAFNHIRHKRENLQLLRWRPTMDAFPKPV